MTEDTQTDTAAQTATAPGVLELLPSDRRVRQPLPMLDVVNERFVRHLGQGLFQLSRRSAQLSTTGVQVRRWEEVMADYTGEMAMPACFGVYGLQPLRGSALVACDSGFVSALVDALYGGGGTVHTPIDRDFSPTEQRVIQRLMVLLGQEYARAWKDVYPLVPSYVRHERLPQFTGVATPQDALVVTTLSITLGTYEGELRLCLPYAALEPIRDVLYGPQQATALAEDRRWVGQLAREIQAAEVTLVAELAQAELSVADLLAMKPGDFIQLDRQPMVLATIEGAPVFACRYGTHNDRYALRIEQHLGSQGAFHEQ